MQARCGAVALVVLATACSSSTNSGSGSPAAQSSELPGTNGSSSESEVVTATGSATAATDTAGVALVTFSDPDSGFETSDVLDADRQIMHFDAGHASLVWAADNARIAGWVAQGDDLSWTGSSVAFQVRFGTEAGERHAYFTESESGTICNLEVNASGQLSIFGTSELPPQ